MLSNTRTIRMGASHHFFRMRMNDHSSPKVENFEKKSLIPDIGCCLLEGVVLRKVLLERGNHDYSR